MKEEIQAHHLLVAVDEGAITQVIVLKEVEEAAVIICITEEVEEAMKITPSEVEEDSVEETFLPFFVVTADSEAEGAFVEAEADLEVMMVFIMEVMKKIVGEIEELVWVFLVST